MPHLQNHPDRDRGRARTLARAFTLIELLVVIAVVIILIGIVLVAVQAATRASQRANTAALMQAIQKGLTEFKESVGYLPPVLGPEDIGGVTVVDEFRAYKAPPDGPDPTNPTDPDPAYGPDIQDWYSYTTIAEYLVGYGPEEDDGADLAGIRSPQADGYWGVAASVGDPACTTFDPGTLAARRCFLGSDLSTSIRGGKIFGPFLELRDERLLGAIAVNAEGEVQFESDGVPRIVFPGEAGYSDELPKVVVDYWGKPVRYYRTLYREGSLNLPYRGFDAAGQPMGNPPTLADVFVLRPWELAVGSGITSVYEDAAADATTTTELKHAQFALISSGQDRKLNDRVRRDTQATGDNSGGYNEDNLIEVAK